MWPQFSGQRVYHTTWKGCYHIFGCYTFECRRTTCIGPSDVCFSSSSSSPTGAPRQNKRDSRQQPSTRQSSAARQRRDVCTSSHQLSTAPTSENAPLNRSPSIEIVVDSDLEDSRRRAGLRTKQRDGRRANNHRPVLERVPLTTQSSHHGYAQPLPWCQDALPWCRDASDERLAEKYYELRKLLLDKLDLRTLTPQVQMVLGCYTVFLVTCL